MVIVLFIGARFQLREVLRNINPMAVNKSQTELMNLSTGFNQRWHEILHFETTWQRSLCYIRWFARFRYYKSILPIFLRNVLRLHCNELEAKFDESIAFVKRT